MPKPPKNSGRRSATLDDKFDLEPRLAKRILELLVERHPELHSEVTVLTKFAIDTPDEFSLASEIFELMDELDEGDAFKRSGRRQGGYTDESEAVAEALSEAVEPYFDQLKKYLQKRNDLAALATCKAIVLSMYRFSKIEYHPLLPLYEEFPDETAGFAVQPWRTAGDVTTKVADSQRKFPADFVRQHVPDWDWLMSQD